MEDALAAGSHLEARGIACSVCKLVKIFPFTDDFLRDIERFDVILFAEECVQRGGIGEQLVSCLAERGWHGTFIHRAVDNNKLTHATVPQMKKILGLDEEHLVQDVEKALTEKKEQ